MAGTLQRRMMNAIETPKQKPSSNVERIGDLHEIMQNYVLALTKNEKTYYDRAKVLTPRFLAPEQLKRQSFVPNVYYIEPFALDDLDRAKEQEDETEIERIRTVIHAYSWASHGPVNPSKAAELAHAFQKESEKPGENLTFNPFEEREGPSLPESKQWETVAQVTGRMEYVKDKVEVPIRFIEKKIEEAWSKFLEPYSEEDKDNKELPWPESRPHMDKQKLPKELDMLEKRLTALRMIRDQLYFQLLYPKLAAFGHSGIKK